VVVVWVVFLMVAIYREDFILSRFFRSHKTYILGVLLGLLSISLYSFYLSFMTRLVVFPTSIILRQSGLVGALKGYSGEWSIQPEELKSVHRQWQRSGVGRNAGSSCGYEETLILKSGQKFSLRLFESGNWNGEVGEYLRQEFELPLTEVDSLVIAPPCLK
jgi:hypothetical protein